MKGERAGSRLAMVLVVWLALGSVGLWLGLMPDTVQAGVTGGGSSGQLIQVSYQVGAGGKVTMNIYKSPDAVTNFQIPATRTVTGAASGKFPEPIIPQDITDPQYIAVVSVGIVTLGHIDIVPGSGYAVKSLTVNGIDKGALTSYDFTGTNSSFAVTFAPAAVATTTAATTAATTKATAKATTAATPAATTAATTVPTTTAAPVLLATTVTTTRMTAAPTTVPSRMETSIQTETVVAAANQASLPPATTTDNPGSMPLWLWFLLFLILFLLILLLLFLFWKRRKKDEEEEKEEAAKATEAEGRDQLK